MESRQLNGGAQANFLLQVQTQGPAEDVTDQLLSHLIHSLRLSKPTTGTRGGPQLGRSESVGTDP